MVTTDKNVRTGVCTQSIDSYATLALRFYSDTAFAAIECMLVRTREELSRLIAGNYRILPRFFSFLKINE